MRAMRYEIRPHHGLCSLFFEGKGYSGGFVRHMADVLAQLRQNPVIRLAEGADELCGCCPNNREGVCTDKEKASNYDRRVLALCRLHAGEELPWLDFSARVRTEIVFAGRRHVVCGDCQWSGLCDAVAARRGLLPKSPGNQK